MTRLPNKALVWTANLLVPGAGHVLLGRIGKGVLGAVLWSVAVGYLFLGLIWPDGDGLPMTARWAWVVAFYAAAQASVYYALRGAAAMLADESREGRFRAALAAYLKGHLDESEAACRALLKEDPDDVEATLQLGYCARQRGDLPAARRHFARARYLDDDGKWDFQIQRELAACVPDARRQEAGPV